MISKSIIDAVEKVFRYLIPGFVFVFLFKLSYPTTCVTLLNNIGKIEFGIYLPCMGMIIYALHRLIFEFVDFILLGCDLDKVGKLIIQAQKNIDEKLLDYLYYKMGIIHFCLILSELLILFSTLFHEKESFVDKYNGRILVCSIVLLILSFIQYLLMFKLQNSICWDQSLRNAKLPQD